MVLEYLFLVTFMWMLMEGVVLYVSLSKVFIKSAKYYIIIFTTASYGMWSPVYIPFHVHVCMYRYSCCVYGSNNTHWSTSRIRKQDTIPLSDWWRNDCVSDWLCINVTFYQTLNFTNRCWLNYESHFIWSFISPVIIIILVS